jgi:digeranylgeranylglycerophospholipid reductase
LHDVIVVGAGPAGSIAASTLAQAGRSVAVLDWRTNLGDKLCTGIIGAECHKRFPPLDEHIHKGAKAVTIVSPDGRRYNIARDETQGFIIDRVAYVASLAQNAREAGAEFDLGQRVTSITVADDGVTVLASGDGGRTSHRARLLIIASGFGSPLLSMVGLRDNGNQPHMVGSQAEVIANDLEDTEVYLGQAIAPGSFGWLVPVAGSRALVGLVSRQELNGHMDRFISTLQQDGKVGEIVKQPKRWGIPLKPLARTYGDRVLVAGDAAGMAKPTTGGGIYYALLSGELAAETAGEALAADDLSARQLRAYEKRWKALFGKEMRVGYMARMLFESLGDSQLDRLLDTLVSCESRDGIISGEFSFDWHSKLILRAINHRDLGGLIRSFGPAVVPFLSKMVSNRA